MEYVRAHGSFDDLPLGRILTALDQTYGRVAPGAGFADHAFAAPADTGEATEHAPVDLSVSSDWAPSPHRCSCSPRKWLGELPVHLLKACEKLVRSL